MSVCHAKKNKNHTIYKCIYCHRSGHHGPYCLRKMQDLKWSKRLNLDDKSLLKSTNTKEPKMI